MMLVNLAGNHSLLTSNICDALRNLKPFLQFKNVKNITYLVLENIHIIGMSFTHLLMSTFSSSKTENIEN